MNKRIIKTLIGGLIVLCGLRLQGQYGNRYEFGKIYSAKQVLINEINNCHTEKELADWQSYRGHYGYCEDDAQNDVRKAPSQPGCLHVHQQCRNNAWVTVIRNQGHWVEVIQKNGEWIPIETPKQEIKRKENE